MALLPFRQHRSGGRVGRKIYKGGYRVDTGLSSLPFVLVLLTLSDAAVLALSVLPTLSLLRTRPISPTLAATSITYPTGLSGLMNLLGLADYRAYMPLAFGTPLQVLLHYHIVVVGSFTGRITLESVATAVGIGNPPEYGVAGIVVGA